MALRHDADARLIAEIDPKSIMPTGITGQYWVISWRETNRSINIGIIAEATDPSPDLDWEIKIPAVDAHIYAECEQQLSELEEALRTGKIISPYPDSLLLTGPTPFGNFDDMADAINELFTIFVEPNREFSPATSPILAEVANRLQRNITLLATTAAYQLARIDGTGLVATLNNYHPGSAAAMVTALTANQKSGEKMSALLTTSDAEKLTEELIKRLQASGIKPIIAPSANTAAAQLI